MEIWRGTIRSFDSGTYRATIEVRGSRDVYLANVKVNKGLSASAVAAGAECIVVFFDVVVPSDGMVVAVWS